MRVLIVSSEPLTPDNTLPSIFELSQARLLGEALDVAILAVSEFPGRRRLMGAWNQWPAVTRGARRHRIGRVAVYEGLALQTSDDFSGRLERWVAAAGRALELYSRDGGPPQVVHAHGRFLNAGAFALGLRRSAGVPYVYTDHSSFYQRGWAPAEARPILKAVIENAAVYSTVSAALARAIDLFLGGSTRAPVMAPNAIDETLETTPPASPGAAPPFTFVNLASLDDNKGVGLLITAFAKAFGGAPAFRLDICGDGPLRGQLESMARDLGVEERVRLLGRLSHPEVIRRIDDSHVLVVASHIETFGVAAIEAMARGRPVVATRCGGPEDLIDGDCGRLVPVGDVAAMAQALAEVAAGYERFDLRAIRARAIETFGKGAFVDRTLGFYRCALQ